MESHIQAATLRRAANELKLLSQYEARLSRDFARTLTQLRQSQKLREQTQPPYRSLASNGQVASPPSQNLAEQTQPAVTLLNKKEGTDTLLAHSQGTRRDSPDPRCATQEKPNTTNHLPPGLNSDRTNPNPSSN
mgnify:CR=1 FL=1